MAAAARAAERDRQRREKQRLREYKEMAKQHALADAANAVARYKEYVAAITSVHCESTSDFVDWKAIAEGSDSPRLPLAPSRSSRSSRHENAAVDALATYTPGMLDRLFGRTVKRQQALQDAVAESAQEKALGARVIAGDLDAFEEVIGCLRPFFDLADFGSEVDVRMSADNERSGAENVRVTVGVRVLGESVVPEESQ